MASVIPTTTRDAQGSIDNAPDSFRRRDLSEGADLETRLGTLELKIPKGTVNLPWVE
jgi:hypothetical protein